MLNDAIDLATLKRVLVIKLRHHGDVLLSSPVFAVLKKHAPHLELDALVYHDTREMLTLHPAIAQVHGIDRRWKRQGVPVQLREELRLIRTLGARRYDLVIHLTEHARGAWLTRLLRPRFSVARRFQHKRGRLWRGSFTHLYRAPATPRHTVEQHLDALRRIGVYPAPAERALVLVPGADAAAAIAARLRGAGLVPRGFIHLHPTSRWLFKTWTVEKYAELIDALHAAGERVVLTGAPDAKERAMVERIRAHVRQPVVDWSGQLNLKELAALCAQAKCFVGVDSVPMHIAAAVQTPAVALFGPSSEQTWGPWQVRARVLASPFTCRPCGLDGCGGGKVSDCLVRIPVGDVVRAVGELTGGG